MIKMAKALRYCVCVCAHAWVCIHAAYNHSQYEKNFDLYAVLKSSFPNCISFPGGLCCFIARVDAIDLLSSLMA